MAKRKKIINPGGINGTDQGIVNINSKDYKLLQKAVQEQSKKQDSRSRIRYKFISLKLQVESYISEDNPEEVLSAGSFLKEYLNVIGVKNKDFAKFIEVEESNLSSIIRGRRKINTELAFKLGQIFNIDPNLWLLIQSKNELLKIAKERKIEYRKYQLEKLIKKVG